MCSNIFLSIQIKKHAIICKNARAEETAVTCLKKKRTILKQKDMYCIQQIMQMSGMPLNLNLKYIEFTSLLLKDKVFNLE